MIAELLLFVGVAAAQSNPPPTGCCTPRQYEAHMGQVGGQILNQQGKEVPTLLDTDNIVHFNYYNRTNAYEIISHSPDAADQHIVLIQDFTIGKQYMYGTGWCTTSKVIRRSFREPCTDDLKATYLGSSVIGYGTTKLDINYWNFIDPVTTMNGTLGVTADRCIPVVEALHGVVSGVPTELAIIFTDLKPGLTKTNVFAVPSSCDNANDFYYQGHPEHVKRAVKSVEHLI